MIRRFLEWLGLIQPVAVPTRPVRRKRKPAVAPLPVVEPKTASKATVKRKAKPAPSHAAVVKAELLNAVADALGRAPAELDPLQPKATIAVNGSLYVIHNTVAALSEFQSRLERLDTKTKAPPVPRWAVKNSSRAIAKTASRED